MIKTFEELLQKCPSDIIEKLEDLRVFKERKDFHPEGNTYEHIRIVTTRLIKTENIDLILAGLFHDICKLDAAKINHKKLSREDPEMFDIMKKEGTLKTYGHEFLARDFLLKHKEFIRQLEGDPNRIAMIVEQHMRIKQMINMRSEKIKALTELPVFKELIIFKGADNMLKPFIL